MSQKCDNVTCGKSGAKKMCPVCTGKYYCEACFNAHITGHQAQTNAFADAIVRRITQ